MASNASSAHVTSSAFRSLPCMILAMAPSSSHPQWPSRGASWISCRKTSMWPSASPASTSSFVIYALVSCNSWLLSYTLGASPERIGSKYSNITSLAIKSFWSSTALPEGSGQHRQFCPRLTLRETAGRAELRCSWPASNLEREACHPTRIGLLAPLPCSRS